MRRDLLVLSVLAAGCLSQDPNETSQDPPVAMLTGTTPTGPAPGEVVPSPCPYPVFQVAADADLVVSWAGLDEAIDGSPVDLTDDVQLSVVEMDIDAATAAVACNDSFDDIEVDHRSISLEDLPSPTEATIPADSLPDGGAAVLSLRYPDHVPHIMRTAAILLQPDAMSTVGNIVFTTDAWLN